MPLVAIRLNDVIGKPLDEEGNELDEGWEIEDKDEVLFWADTGDVWDIENALMDIRDALVNWNA